MSQRRAHWYSESGLKLETGPTQTVRRQPSVAVSGENLSETSFKERTRTPHQLYLLPPSCHSARTRAPSGNIACPSKIVNPTRKQPQGSSRSGTQSGLLPLLSVSNDLSKLLRDLWVKGLRLMGAQDGLCSFACPIAWPIAFLFPNLIGPAVQECGQP